MQFRRLTMEELQGLEKEFVQFLVVHGIDAREWEGYKVTAPEKAEGLIDLFSDFIFTDIIRGIRHLEHFSGTTLRLFACEREMITLLSVSRGTGYRTTEEMVEAIGRTPAAFTVQRATKSYRPSREDELFRMLESGALVTNGTLYGLLTELL